MTTIFIAGSITIKHLDPLVVERLKKIVAQEFSVIVGDANGVDSSIQEELLNMDHPKTTVFCSSPKPRNNVGSWPVNVVKTSHARSTRAFHTAKDIAMAENADCGLMVWDAKSTGTLNNVIELLKRKKNSVVFLNKARKFIVIKSPEHLDRLVQCMSAIDLAKADEKIKLNEKISQLKNLQINMFA